MLYCKKQTGGEPLIDIQKDIRELSMMGLMEKLLADKTTGRHILWTTDAYETEGEAYGRGREIELAEISLVKTRARKAAEQQSSRTRQHGEVFTPRWVCDFMNDALDRDWFGVEKMEPDVWEDLDALFLQKKGHKTPRWQRYVDSRRLEITCGEAPYLAERYDVSTGEEIEVSSRRGLLDRKLLAISHFTETREDWQHWALRAMEATYGYEFQGDNLLIARVNIMKTVMEHYFSKWEEAAPASFLQKLTNKVAWNLWQMDGLSGRIPYCAEDPEGADLFSFGDIDIRPLLSVGQPVCRVYSWRSDCQSVSYEDVKARSCGMRFDYIVGNPPYQDETIGENKTYAPPVYHLFINEVDNIGGGVELIHPARFLFNAGATPKDWNKKMLSDPHLKILSYEADSRKIFGPGVVITGGVAISYRDRRKEFGAIKVFSPFPELNAILKKTTALKPDKRFDEIIYIQTRLNLEKLYADHPEYRNNIGSQGKDSRLERNIFEKINCFYNQPSQSNDLRILGIEARKRAWKYIKRDYIDLSHENLFSYKVIMSTSNGAAGTIGVQPVSICGEPYISKPGEGYTRTFLGIGAFAKESEALNCAQYIKTKFCRCMLGILKATQLMNKDVWHMIPLQDFSAQSDIDWTCSIKDIDNQLYKKYHLSANEISFIESHIKEMK